MGRTYKGIVNISMGDFLQGEIMIISIHQPNYIPWLGYFEKIKDCDVFIFLDDVQYSGNKVSNRNLIRTENGSQYLSIPIKQRREVLNKIEIDNSVKWQEKHWNCIKNSYRNSPGWDYLANDLEMLYKTNWSKLVNINMESINLIANKLNISCEFICSSKLKGEFGKNSERILNICKYFNADLFLSGAGAKEYLDIDSFIQNGIEIKFQEFKHPQYKQIREPFIPNLSAIDFLFQCGESAGEIFNSMM